MPRTKTKSTRQSAKEQVDAYNASAPKAAQPMLRLLRRTIRASAPAATETLSYGMPYYHLHGRLTYFAAFSKHVSLFVMGRPTPTLAREMKPYQTSKATLRFPLGTPVPVRLVAKIVRARARENEAKRKPAGG